MTDLDTVALAEALDRAMDALLSVRVALGGPNVAVPDTALDSALHGHPEFQQARRGVATALGRLLHAAGGQLRVNVLAIEETANRMVANAAVVAWRLGVRVRGGAGD